LELINDKLLVIEPGKPDVRVPINPVFDGSEDIPTPAFQFFVPISSPEYWHIVVEYPMALVPGFFAVFPHPIARRNRALTEVFEGEH
jgi:hypothetical protein